MQEEDIEPFEFNSEGEKTLFLVIAGLTLVSVISIVGISVIDVISSWG